MSHAKILALCARRRTPKCYYLARALLARNERDPGNGNVGPPGRTDPCIVGMSSHDRSSGLGGSRGITEERGGDRPRSVYRISVYYCAAPRAGWHVVSVCVCIYVYMYLYMCVYTYIYIYIHSKYIVCVSS